MAPKNSAASLRAIPKGNASDRTRKAWLIHVNQCRILQGHHFVTKLRMGTTKQTKNYTNCRAKQKECNEEKKKLYFGAHFIYSFIFLLTRTVIKSRDSHSRKSDKEHYE